MMIIRGHEGGSGAQSRIGQALGFAGMVCTYPSNYPFVGDHEVLMFHDLDRTYGR